MGQFLDKFKRKKKSYNVKIEILIGEDLIGEVQIPVAHYSKPQAAKLAQTMVEAAAKTNVIAINQIKE